MDTAFLNFHKEEDFSSYLSSYGEDSQSYDGINNTNASDYHWLDYDRELNGDMGLIPMPSENNCTLSTSPPIKEDYNKIMSDWNNLVSLEVNDVLVEDMANATAASLNLSASVVLPNPDDDMLDIKEEDFDITKYVVGSEPSTPEKMFSAFTRNECNISSSKQIDNAVVNHERDTKPAITIKQELDVSDEEKNEEDIFEDYTFKVPFIKQENSMYLEGSWPSAIPQQKFGGKRIDMARGRYMFDEEETTNEESDDEDIAVDVETIESETNPVLQAGDLDSLLEQFEATETTNMQLHQQTSLTPERDLQSFQKTEPDISLGIIVEQVKLISPIKSPIVTAKKAKRQLLDFRDAELQGISPTNPLITKVKLEKLDSPVPKVQQIISEPVKLPKDPKTIKVEVSSPKPPTPDVRNSKLASSQSPVKDQRKNKQILEALPTELIDRIRASSKRKRVPVIEPIAPTKRRMLNSAPSQIRDPITNSTLANRIINSAVNNMTTTLASNNNKVFTTTALSDTTTIMLDHDYCTYADVHYVNKDGTSSAKDSGFSSAEEDEKAIITAQPTIKGSDGKLMVSLLKTNTIKKKLNLEEYKKRLQSRPNASGGTSPADEDDENARRLKHQEMLMKMAQDYLKRGANSQDAGNGGVITLPTIQIPQVGIATTTTTSTKSTTTNTTTTDNIVAIKTEHDDGEKTVEVKKLPKNIVMKTLVSVGTNTEESWGHLEQILDNTHIKISPNSLISSIVEQLPKAKVVDSSEQVEHGEDKTIVFIDKTQPKKSTRGVLVQTLHSSSHLLRQRRRRTFSLSSSSCRSSSSSSTSSYSSDSDSARSSRSRSRGERGSRSRSHSRSRHSNSRTPSPVRRKRQEIISEVEERRRVYVGRIADDTTKEDLRRRFARFGPITNLSVHFRRHADNYGFVTFLHKEDAYEAVGRGNENADDPQYDLSFGGRRLFCLNTYSDLDNMPDDTVYADYCPWSQQGMVGIETLPVKDDDYSFDNLLRKAQAKLRNRKT